MPKSENLKKSTKIYKTNQFKLNCVFLITNIIQILNRQSSLRKSDWFDFLGHNQCFYIFVNSATMHWTISAVKFHYCTYPRKNDFFFYLFCICRSYLFPRLEMWLVFLWPADFPMVDFPWRGWGGGGMGRGFRRGKSHPNYNQLPTPNLSTPVVRFVWLRIRTCWNSSTFFLCCIEMYWIWHVLLLERLP